MPGAELQLAAYGKQDLVLTGNPQISHFQAVYKRYTNFAIETYEEMFEGDANFGTKVYAILGRYGDLISQIYVDIKLPALNQKSVKFDCDKTGCYDNPIYEEHQEEMISWINSVGHALLRVITIEIGGQKIDEHYGIWLEIWNELTLPLEKRWGYNDMVGKKEYFNISMQQGEMHLRIPLQFWFCRHYGLALPSIALQNHEIRLTITFEEFDKLWVSSTGKLPENLKKDQVMDIFKMNQAMLLVDYVFLEDEERREFAYSEHEILIEQLQYNIGALDLTSVDNVIPLDFNHPVKELIWVFRECASLLKVPGGGNEWFNFSTKPMYMGGDVRDYEPLEEAIILFNGDYLFFPYKKAKYFRELQPYKHHTNIPDNYIYVYSFALHPELYQPTGTADFSMLDNAQINFKMKTYTTSQIETIMFATNYNILKIKNGMAGLLFMN